MNYDTFTEFTEIKARIMELAYTENAKQKLSELVPYLSELEVRTGLRETSEGKEMIERLGTPPATALNGIEDAVRGASMGACLTPGQLEEVAVMLTVVRRMRDYLSRGKIYNIGVAFYEENLDSLDEIHDEITGKIRGGRVDDYATKTLHSIREQIERTRQKMHEKADHVLRTHKDCMADSFSTMRNGHLCVPVKKEYKFRVSGSVIDKSSTGNTLFIEPTTVAQYAVTLQELAVDEENEERQVLYYLSGLLLDKEEIMNENRRMLERLDFIFAKARYSLAIKGIEPKINLDRCITLKEAKHPLMNPEQCVPLDFTIGGTTRGVVITGPNTGGKTVAIKTVALTCMMAQSGLHVSAVDADVCLNSNFLCDIGDGQNLSENLSTFSAHITNVLAILKHATHDSLVILDELGSGTDPAEGMGIAIAILEELRECGALFLVTTHYPEVKDYAKRQEGIVNARMTFDKESLCPQYQLVIGEAGESCAFYIASRLGMPKQMLVRAAKAAYGDEHVADDVLEQTSDIKLQKESHTKIQRIKKTKVQTKAQNFQRGDSVMVMPDRKIGIVCETTNEKGVLRVQLQGKKIWINYKRVKLVVPAKELYPDDYDFSIVFDSVEKRKAMHLMERKYTTEGYEFQEE